MDESCNENWTRPTEARLNPFRKFILIRPRQRITNSSNETDSEELFGEFVVILGQWWLVIFFAVSSIGFILFRLALKFTIEASTNVTGCILFSLSVLYCLKRKKRNKAKVYVDVSAVVDLSDEEETRQNNLFSSRSTASDAMLLLRRLDEQPPKTDNADDASRTN